MRHATDVDGFLAGLGTDCRVKGSEYLGIFADEFDLAEPGGGRVRVATQSIEVLFATRDARRMALALGDTVGVFEVNDEVWIDYTVRSIQRMPDDFSRVRLSAQV